MGNVIDIEANELRGMIKGNRENLEIIDVRENSEYKLIRIKDSKLIPMGELEMRINEIDWSKDVVFVCRTGSRSRLMASLLSSNERKIKNLKYGIHECYLDGKGDNLEVSEDVGRYF